ncbi:MAG: tetratricopeptide repeat protein [Chitinophagaceae bacterium]|nr:tetratricopeptide repeat protein [Chitinophagaceae bacterium]
MSKSDSILSIIILSVLCFSCSPTQIMTMSVQQPAPVSMPSYIKSVAIINRSLAAKQSRAVDIADKLFSLEGANLDKEGAEAGIRGLSDALVKENRFEDVRVVSLSLTTVSPVVFPSPLSWDVVEKICRENHADALFSLELFDTDSKISYSANPVKLNTPLGAIPGIEHHASMLTLVKTGWRIYDPASKTVLDEFPVTRQISYMGKGINPVIAANALIGRKEAVKEVGSQSGEAYAQRIVPYLIRVSRDYYVRGTANFTLAKRRAQTGHWDEAAELWQRESGNPKRKIAGRACYNMAIINEINGNLDKAIEWAQRSYEEYNNHPALQYVNILKDRKFRSAILKDQQSGMAMQRE